MENINNILKENKLWSFDETSLPLSTPFYRDDASIESIRQESVKNRIVNKELSYRGEKNETSPTISPSKIKYKEVGFDDDSFQNPQLYQNPFSVEQWEVSTSLDARIFQLDKKSVSCDCLVDPDERLFEKRIFPRQLFEHLFELEVGRLIIIKIRSKKGSMRIDVTDGRGIVAPELFELEELWNSLKGF